MGGQGQSNEIEFTLWVYDIHLEDSDGNQLTKPSKDFHIVAGVIDKDGNESSNIYSKNGARPIENSTGKSEDFKPKDKDEARENNSSNKVALDGKGKPIYKVRTNMKEYKFYVPTVESEQ